MYGTRKAGGTEIIGVHSPKVLNDSNFKIEQIFARNSDGTINVKLVKKLDTGWSKPKSSVLFPESWSDQKIVSSIRYVSVGKAIAKRSSDGATLHRGIIHSVNIEVIKVKNIITSGYPNGGIGALPSGFEILQ